MSTIIFTMAGESRRFREAGYSVPKYRLQARGRTLLRWSVDSVGQFVDDQWRLLFVGRTDDEDLDDFLHRELDDIGTEISLLRLDRPTDGQASTALRARGHVGNDEPIAIFNIDTQIDPAALSPRDVRGDGWLPCFEAEGDGWSFADVGSEGRVREVREKVRISDHCTVGFYYFGTFDLFCRAYETTIDRTGGAEQAERYVAPLYNALIASGGDVRAHCLSSSAVVPLGTPDELAVFAGAEDQI